jgi:hypothetical protein
MKPSPIHHEDEITFEADIFGFGDVGKWINKLNEIFLLFFQLKVT